jgi:hypothetical protein
MPEAVEAVALKSETLEALEDQGAAELDLDQIIILELMVLAAAVAEAKPEADKAETE